MKTKSICRGLSSAAAFTLIELLVVIAIIGILAAIALPIISGARQSGNQVKSVNRLRTIQQSNFQYSAEHNGFFVPFKQADAQNPNGGTVYGAWWFTNPEFLKMVVANTGAYYYGKPPDSFTSALVPYALSSQWGTSLGYSVGSGNRGTVGNDYSPPVASGLTLSSPAHKMAFAESQDTKVLQYKLDAYDPKKPEQFTADAMAFRYKGKASIVFYDGHVGQMTKAEVVAAYKPSDPSNSIWLEASDLPP